MRAIVGYRPLAIDYEVLPPFANEYSLDFDGVGEYMTCGYMSELDAIQTFTISMWVKFDNVSGAQRIIGKTHNAVGHISLASVSDEFYPSINGQYGATTDANLVGGTWYHIAMIFDGTLTDNINRLKFYIDGMQKTLSFPGTIPSMTYNFAPTPATWYLGTDGFSTPNYYGGLMDEVGIFNTAEPIANLWDGSGSPTNLVSLNPVAWYRMGENGLYREPQWLIPSDENNDNVSNYSMDFDGVNDRVIVGNNTSFNFVHETGIFTMSYWLRLTDYTIAGPIRISGNNGTSSARNGFEFDYNQVVGERRLRLRITVNPIAVILSATTINAITDNDWHNVIIQGDGTNVYFTIDGVTQTGSGTMSGLGAGDADYPLSIGSVNGYTPEPMNGDLDEVAFFNTNLIDTSTIYNGGVPADLTALSPLAWYKMGENATYKSPQWLIPSDENKDKISNYSMKFSGGGQIVGIGTGLDLGTDSTVSFWVKRDAVAVNEAWLGEDTYTSDYFAFITSTEDFYIRIGLSAYVGWTSTTAQNIFNNTTDWISVVVVRSGDTIELFLDGALMPPGVPVGVPGATVTRFDTIGAKPGLGNSTKARFAEVAGWNTNTVLPADIYNLGVLPDLSTVSPAPVSYWKMGDNATYSGVVWTVPDEVGANDGTSVNMVIGDRIGDTPNSTLNGTSLNMTIEDRAGESPNTTNNALSYNMIELDRVPETP